MTTPGPAKPLTDLLRGTGPSNYGDGPFLAAFLATVDTITGVNKVTDGAQKYNNLSSLIPYASLTVGPVLLAITPGQPVILGPIYVPNVPAPPADPSADTSVSQI